MHVQRIGEDQTAEPELLREHMVHRQAEGARQPARGVDGRHFEVGHHHGGKTFIHQALEGIELQGIEACPRVCDERQAQVAVHVGIAVPGEVLRRGNDTTVLQATHISDCFARHVLAVLTEAAVVDDRVRRVVVHVGHWAEAHVHAKALHLTCDLAAHAFDERVVRECAERHLLREAHAAVQPHGQTPLQVHSDEQRCTRNGLIVVGEGRLPRGAALEKDEPADVLLLDERGDLLLVFRAFVAPRRHHHQLGYLLVDVQGGVHAVGPWGGLGKERRRKSVTAAGRQAAAEQQEGRGRGSENERWAHVPRTYRGHNGRTGAFRATCEQNDRDSALRYAALASFAAWPAPST